MMMKMNAMGERPPMPDMSGANMRKENPMNAMPAKGRENLMKSSQEIAAVNAQNAKTKPQQAMPKQMGALGNM